MKILILISILLFLGCSSTKNIRPQNEDLVGTYKLESDLKFQALSDDRNYSSLVLNSDGTYNLNKAAVTFTPVIEQCDYASKGKWSIVANNVIEITSENYFVEQEGFEYDMKNENKLSQDSLYIQVNFPTDFQPVKLGFTFNHNNSKSITTDETYIVLPKSQYLWNRRTGTNHISFNLNAEVSGTTIYKSRILFKIFEEYIDTEKYNYLSITLPNFDRCFFEFEPYYQDLILIKGRNQLLWQGDIWRK